MLQKTRKLKESSKKISFFLILVCTLGFLISSCATSPPKTKNGNKETDPLPNNNPVFLSFNEQVMEEMEREAIRAPASNSTFLQENKVELRDFHRLKPEKFEVYVLPKISNMTSKTLSEDVELGRPQVFFVQIVGFSPCPRMTREFTKFGTDVFFASAPAGLDCAILEIENQKITQKPHDLIRGGEEKRLRLFLDSQYKVYGSQIETYVNSQDTRFINQLHGDSTYTSGLSIFPVELNTRTNSVDVMLMSVLRDRVDPITRNVVKADFKRFEIPDCRGKITKYQNSFGENVEVGWCKGLPWPSYIETNRYIAVTQTLSLR